MRVFHDAAYNDTGLKFETTRRWSATHLRNGSSGVTVPLLFQGRTGPAANSNSLPRNHSGVPAARC